MVRARADAVVRRQHRRADSGFRLSIEERIEIGMRVAAGESDAEIARGLGRHRSTIGRELARCGKRRGHYAPFVAERRARRLACRPKLTKLAGHPQLLAWVEQKLSERFSPEQIAARLRLEFPDDPSMSISHETIYQSLFVQARGELRRELAGCLRSGRTRRKPHGHVERRGRIAGMVMISERPAEVEDRAVPGHWEGDLLMGKANASQVATLVERSTRFVMLAALQDRTAEHVAQVLAQRIQTLPGELWRSLTWDQGREMARHRDFTVATDVTVYFCDPHSPWQRGSNENTNGLLRQYFPKGTDLSVHSAEYLDFVADQMNGRPRQTLKWRTPAEKLTETVAMAA
ncbi:MAG TPA: IS30 family transposase [Actinomycetota bacterium]|nr:IS30 family transposase [Actinomycetota bacterium]